MTGAEGCWNAATVWQSGLEQRSCQADTMKRYDVLGVHHRWWWWGWGWRKWRHIYIYILYNEEFTEWFQAEWFQAANVCFVVIADISKAFWDAHLAAMLARACDADSSILVLHHHSDPSWRRSTFQPRLVIFFPVFRFPLPACEILSPAK